MAEVLVAGAVLSAVFNVLFEKMAAKEVVDFFKQRKLDVKLLNKLKTRMNTVSGMLEDAEDKQTTNSAVRKWLDDLKDVAYDADDFLDEIAYKAGEQLKIEADPNTCSHQVRNFFSSLNPCKKGMGELQPLLNEIFERLDDLLQQNDFLHLEKRDGVRPSLLSRERVTTSLVDESGVYGRDDDKEAIVKLLLTDDKCLDVIPIVGMGGVGKTTISQLVYKDSRVKQMFSKLKAWVCVSEEFDVLKLTKNILKEIGSSNCDSEFLNDLQLELVKKVRGERILLVLDDVWSHNHATWELLLTPMKSAAQGSKVLVTTREERVASVMSTVPSYYLKQISEDDGWLLFAKHALDGRDSDVDAHLKEIGREIVKKCKGLPLAAKTIGSLLRSERRVGKWEQILKSNMWELEDGTIIPALRLSYHYLPSQLKQCFAYCAMFPKDFLFRKEELSLLWMAEGFIVQNNNKRKEMEEIGEEYFEDLLSRSFFQKYGSEEDVFVMHDLINDLAKSIAGEVCYNNVDNASSGQLTERTRHLFYKGGNGSNALQELESLSKAKLLRTFIYKIQRAVYGDTFNFFPRLRRLRVLHIHTNIRVPHEEVSISGLVSNAKHLRFLQLESLYMQSLPKDIHTLWYLQTLKIKSCWGIASLPDSIGCLNQLRHLEYSNSSTLMSLPDSLGDLKNLRHLNLMNSRLGSLSASIGNLKDLRHLNLMNSRLESIPASIGNLKALRHLNLNNATQLKSLSDSIGNLKGLRHLDLGRTSLEQLPDSLCGLHSLQHLSLRGCWKLLELPVKMMDVVSLCHLDIRNTKLKSMPPEMGKLVKLQYLSDFFMGKNGRGSNIAELGKLRYLHGELMLRNLRNVMDAQIALEVNLKDKSHLEGLEYEWEAIEWEDDNADTHDISVDRSLLQHLQPNVNVKYITIRGYRGTDFPNWVGDSSFCNIVKLSLRNCKYCTRLPPLGQLVSLQNLSLFRFESIVSVGAEFFGDSKSIQPFRSLQSLTFESMPKWQEWTCTENDREDDGCTAFPLLQNLEMRDFPELGEGILHSTLQRLLIQGCKTIISRHMIWDSHEFILRSAEDILSFPGMILLPSTVTSIKISSLQNLKSLDYTGFQHLTSLRTLVINSCPNLGCIPDGGLPESLNYLSISHCPLLEKRCQEEEGEDWPKISRIPYVDINNCLHLVVAEVMEESY